jgi:hypothetical protein
MASYANARISGHALEEMRRRRIDKSIILEILAHPDTLHTISSNRIVLHKILIAEDMKKALLYRVFIDVDCSPPVVVTAYRTSKISKYERPQ